jgi:GAF domain-containing protein
MAVHAPKAAPVKKPRTALKAKRRDRTQDLPALYATFATLVSSDPAEVLQSAVELLKSATLADAAIIRILDPSTESFTHIAQVGFSSVALGARRQLNGSSDVNTALRSGEPMIVADIAKDARLKGKKQLSEGYRSCAFLPIMVADKLRGLIHLVSRTAGRFSEAEKENLTAIARQMGTALENRELFEQTQKLASEIEKRYGELQFLHELSQAVLSSPDMPSTLAAALKKVLASTRLDVANIRLFDASGRLEHSDHLGYRDANTSPHHFDSSNSGHAIFVPRVMASRQSAIVNDIAGVEGLRTFKREGVRSAIVVPIATDTEALGVIEVGSRTPRVFRAEEVRLLESMGAQLGLAVQKARLFAETQQRQEEQAAINAIAMATTESLHVDELLKIALAKVLEVTGRSRGSIKLKDATGKIVLAAHQGISEEYARTIRSHLAPEETASQIFESGEVVVVDDPEKNLFDSSDREAGLRSLIWVPLKARGAVIGILNVSTPQSEPFSARKIELLKSIGHVIGIAVENARLFEETERRGREQAALHAVTAAVGGSFDLDQTLARALDTVLDATGMDGGYIYLLDAEPGPMMIKAHRGMSESFIERMKNEREIGVKTTQIVASKEPVTLENIPADYQGRFKGEHITAAAWIPIIAKNAVVGILVVCTRNRPTFPKLQLPLLSSIGNALGVALENARLFRETDRHLKRLQALREIDQAISSTLDLENVLKILLEKIDVTLPYASATIRLIDRSTGLLQPIACRNLDEVEWKKDRTGRGIPNLVYTTKAPLVIRDVRADARASDLEFYHKNKLVSYAGVPLVVKQEIIGVLGFYTKEEHEFEIEEINFLATLAGQAAIAIQNSKLYEEARLREKQLEDGNRMLAALHAAAAAASQSLDLDRVLKAVIEKITEIFGFYTTEVHIYDAARGELVLGGYFDSDAGRSVRSFRLGQGIVGRVAATGESLVFDDIRTDARYDELSHSKRGGRQGHRFFGVFPIRGKLQNLGTLACTGIEPRHLTPSEITLIEALADQLAVAIENSQLVDELKHKVDELERANKVKDEFLSVMSHELRTPLNVVIGYAGLLREGMLGATSPEQNKALDKLVTRTSDLLSMITSILYAASIDANEVRVERDQFALGEFLDDIKRGYASRISKPIELVWDYAPDLPVVFSDRDKVKCILQNLIGNAIKFTDAGRVTVSARAQQAGRADETQTGGALASALWMEFNVSDTGIGIAAEKLPVIFEKFRQADSSETRPYGGVGLGLYIAKCFAELLGGKIAVETAFGRGSTFTVKLPCRYAFDLTTIELRGGEAACGGQAPLKENDIWVKA